jgi:hypothetical protein
MKTPFKYIAGILLMTALLTATPVHAEPEQAVQTLFTNLLTALVRNDYEGFAAECTPARQSVLTRPAFAESSQKIAARANGGYDALYFGDYRQKGHTGYVWRLRFKDGGDDILATLIPTDGKCSMLYLH